MSTNLNSNLEVLFSKMENFVTSKTIVGEPIVLEDIVIIPLVDICLGVGASASDTSNLHRESGVGGLGAKITPSSIVIIQNGIVKLINAKTQDGLSKLIDLVPDALSKLGIGKKED
jgi:uncharacterized spore protein YtfJ